MNDTELDGLLTSAPTELPDNATREARRMADAAMPARVRRGKLPRPRWMLPVLVGGALALTAGAGTATIAMSHWAGVSMPFENVRSTVPIPVTWTTESGHEENCRAWIELRNPQPGDRDTLDEAIRGHDWDGLGQQLYDSSPAIPDDPSGGSRVGDALTPVVLDFADTVFPGIPWATPSDDLRSIDAWGFTCVPEAP